jgi:hypothetical protein
MPVRRDSRTGRWFFRKQVRMPNGRRVRIFGVPQSFVLANTKLGAEEAERREVQRVLNTGVVKLPTPEKVEAPTVEEFAKVYLDVARVDSKPSSVDTKEQILRWRIVPFFGKLRLDRVSYAVIQDFKVKEIAEGRSTKTVNNYLTTLRRLLVIAASAGLSPSCPRWSGSRRRSRTSTSSTSTRRADSWRQRTRSGGR